MFHVDLPRGTQVTLELSPNHCYTTIHWWNDRICAPNKIKIGKNAFSHLFRMHSAITISAMMSRHLGTMSRIKVFLHQAWIACQWRALLRCSAILTECQLLTNTLRIIILSFSKTSLWHVLHATLSKSLNFIWPMTPTAQMWLVNPTDYKI